MATRKSQVKTKHNTTDAAPRAKPAAKPVAKGQPAAQFRTPSAKARSKQAGAPETAARKAVIATALKMSRSRLSPGRSGNVSCRWADGMLITPTGLAYEILKPADIVFVDADGATAVKGRLPSSEWRFHLAAYRTRPDMAAVVHTHSLHATVLACAHKPIPAFHYMVAVAGGTDVPLIPYAPFGTEELAGHVAGGLANRNALLMANHGQIAIGKDLPSALELAAEVEVLAEQFYKVLTLGKPRLLGRNAMSDVLVRFKSYGQNAPQK